MVTDLKSRLSYHRRLFLLLLLFSWTLVACFVLFQYGREKHFKAEQLNARLQLLNLRMLDAVDGGTSPETFVARQGNAFGDLRVTIVGLDGRVLFDNSLDTLPAANHLDRPEVAEAAARGTGYTIRRHSESTHRNYFYSAMLGDSCIVRTAVPYSVPLSEVLAADREFLWFMLGVTLLMSVAGYFATRRLGQNITRLNEFAERAERGERIDERTDFPHDELGDISQHIIRLYARLQKTTADRDREHALALHEEQEKIRIKKQLTNNINHELKTPVAAIQGYLETLLANPDLDAGKRTDFLEKSAAQTGRLRSLLAEEKCDIFCTGSNAQMLSGELATHLAGRSVSFDVHSLSYREFLTFHRLEAGQENLKKYLTFGGMPYLAHIGLEADVPFEYLRSVYSTILLKDTVAREKIRNVHFLEDLVAYLADNIGNLFSANNISKFLKSQRVDLSPQVTLNYLRALSNAYLIHRVSRAEVGGMKIFETGEKFYFEDIGISHAIRGFNFRRDVHKVMENAVYLHLIQQGYSVHVGQLKEQEIDFVADKSGDKLYVQMSLSVTDEKTAAREFGNLLAVQDNYPKYVVTLNDMILGDNQEGIRHMNLEEFLLKEL